MLNQSKTTSNTLALPFSHSLSQVAFKSKPKQKKSNKLHSSDIPYLRVVRFYQFDAKNKKCHLTPPQWPGELQKFGGKPLSVPARKTKRQKLERLSIIGSSYEYGNRNKEKTPYLTKKGLAALEEWERNNPQGGQKRRKSYPQMQKNDPAKCEKRSGETQKTIRPLSSGSVNVVNDHELAKRNVKKPEANPVHKTLSALGLYPGLIKRVLATTSESDIRVAFQQTQKHRPKIPGAYFMSVLNNLLSEETKDRRNYELEEKSKREKELEFGHLAKRSEGCRSVSELLGQLQKN